VYHNAVHGKVTMRGGSARLVFRAILLCLATLPILESQSLSTQPRNRLQSRPKSRFIKVNGVRLHYLDWGGSGETIVFLHSLSWTAYKYSKFAPRFTHKYRVLALTRRGSGLSDKPATGYDVRTQVEDLKQFLDALNIKMVTLIGNSLPADEMTLFAGIYPERVNKLVYLTGFCWDNARFADLASKDPTRMWQMNDRADYNAFQRKVTQERRNFSPDYTRVKAPVLAFYGKDRWWKKALMLYDVDDEPELISHIKDRTARKYFEKLRENREFRKEVEDYWNKVYLPYFDEQVARFRRELANLRAVNLDLEVVTGYEFETRPDLIAPAILKFLEEF